MKFRKILCIFIILILLVVSGLTAVYMYKNRNAKTVTSSMEIVSDNVVAFYQKDDLWKDDFLGESKYHMSDSGCLTTCIAAELLMQEVSVDGVSDINPGTLNKFFSENDVYDGEGNLQWDVAGSVLGGRFTQKETSEITEKEIENFIKKNVYPIVCVKMPKSGNYHFVVLTGADKNGFLCMDPLNKNGKTVSLSEYNNKIYSVRYFE